MKIQICYQATSVIQTYYHRTLTDVTVLYYTMCILSAGTLI